MTLRTLCEKCKTDKSNDNKIIKLCVDFEITKRKLNNKYREEQQGVKFPDITIAKITDNFVRFHYWPFGRYDDGPTSFYVSFNEFENFNAAEYEQKLKDEKIWELEEEIAEIQKKIDKLKS